MNNIPIITKFIFFVISLAPAMTNAMQLPASPVPLRVIQGENLKDNQDLGISASCTKSLEKGELAVVCGNSRLSLGNADNGQIIYSPKTQSYLIVKTEAQKMKLFAGKSVLGGIPKLVDVTSKFSRSGFLRPTARISATSFASQGIIRVWNTGAP